MPIILTYIDVFLGFSELACGKGLLITRRPQVRVLPPKPKSTVFHTKYGTFSNFLGLKVPPHFGLSNIFLTQRILNLQFILTHHGRAGRSIIEPLQRIGIPEHSAVLNGRCLPLFTLRKHLRPLAGVDYVRLDGLACHGYALSAAFTVRNLNSENPSQKPGGERNGRYRKSSVLKSEIVAKVPRGSPGGINFAHHACREQKVSLFHWSICFSLPDFRSHYGLSL